MAAVKSTARCVVLVLVAASWASGGPIGQPGVQPQPQLVWRYWSASQSGVVSNASETGVLSAPLPEGNGAESLPWRPSGQPAARTRVAAAPQPAAPRSNGFLPIDMPQPASGAPIVEQFSNAPLLSPAPAPAAPSEVPAPPQPPGPAFRPAVLATPAPASIVPPAPTPAPASIVPPAPTPAPVRRADAFINLTPGSFAQSGDLLSGQATAWYNSPVAQQAFGGVPTEQQRAEFSNLILARVNDAFQRSGLNPTLTLDPNVPADHTMSVVAGASYNGDPDTIGITDVGRNGFSLIDKMGAARTVDDLAWVVAHNVAHELMHAFGVAEHFDQSGSKLDTAVASYNLLTDPSATFSPQAVAALQSDGMTFGLAAQMTEGGHPWVCACQRHAKMILAAAAVTPVPEPATIALWVAAGLIATAWNRARRRTA